MVFYAQKSIGLIANAFFVAVFGLIRLNHHTNTPPKSTIHLVTLCMANAQHILMVLGLCLCYHTKQQENTHE